MWRSTEEGDRLQGTGNSRVAFLLFPVTCSLFPISEIALTFNLHSYMERKRQDVETALDRYLPPTTARPETLHDSLRYSVLAPGKRLRPILVLASAEAVGGSAQDVMPTACALECIHAFSLIHDDLPCMDNDDYRRGRLTNHKVYGEAMALLAGDALLALAFQMIADNGKLVIAERIIPVLHLVAEASGTWGMVGGQVVDMQSQGQEVTPDTLRYIHGHKTGPCLPHPSCLAQCWRAAMIRNWKTCVLTAAYRAGVPDRR